MKQKYTLSIADMELNVTVDESPETVEYIVGVIDRKMREILLKSKYCPKTQAAILCALDLCADKVKAKQEIEVLQEELESLEEALKASEEKYDRTQKLNISIEKEKARLEIENMRLRSIIEDAKRDGTAPTEDIDNLNISLPDALVSTPEEAVEEVSQKPKQSKSRVGSMFDLLTFSDI